MISAGIKVVLAAMERSTDTQIEFTHFDWGSDYYKKTGTMMPEDGLETLKPFDAIFFGAVGARMCLIILPYGVASAYLSGL